jgi:hypothetical protein
MFCGVVFFFSEMLGTKWTRSITLWLSRRFCFLELRRMSAFVSDNVVDPDTDPVPVGSETFIRIRIWKYHSADPDPASS